MSTSLRRVLRLAILCLATVGLHAHAQHQSSVPQQWQVQSTDKTLSAVVSRWAKDHQRVVQWTVPFDPPVRPSERLNAELRNASDVGQAIGQLITSYNRFIASNNEAFEDDTILACIYDQGRVAAVFTLASHRSPC